MAIYKRCGICGKRIPSGSRCECIKQKNKKRYKEYDNNKRDEETHKFYNTTEWKRLREWAKYYYKKIDIYSYYVLKKLEYGQTVHHIVPIKLDWSKRLSKENLIYLTEANHQLIHKRMENGETKEVIKELTELSLKFKEEFYL